MREWITTDCRNTPSTTNPEEEEIVDAPGKDGNASMPEQVKRPNPCRKMMVVMIMMMMMISELRNSHYRNISTDFLGSAEHILVTTDIYY